jgi:CDP-glucose 4,6-dehydratase
MESRKPSVGDLGVTTHFWASRSVLVTGAAGLLGGWVARKLSGAGARVIGLDIDWSHGALLGGDHSVERLDGDVRGRDLLDRVLAERGIDTVIHLAAQAIVGPANQDPPHTFEHNILGTWTTLEACRYRPQVTSIIVASSDKAYGDHGGAPYDESMALLGRHPYAASKTCADVLAQTYAESFGLPVAITRCGNMYGGGDTEWSRIVPGTIRSLIRGERPVIRSDGHFIRDYLYVEDGAQGVMTLARVLAQRQELSGEAFNFGAGSQVSVLEVVRRILELMRADLEPDIRDEATNEIAEQRVSAAKAREVLGWVPAHTLEQGLALTIDWYRTHFDTGA